MPTENSVLAIGTIGSLEEAEDIYYDEDPCEIWLKERCVCTVDYGTRTATVTFPKKWSLYMFCKLTGWWDFVLCHCPNKRVTYLMKHGKNPKVRFKNYKRGLKIICDIFDRGGKV